MHSNDVNPKGIVAFLGILAATMVVIYGVIAAMAHAFERNARQADARALAQMPATAKSQRPYFPFPREQPDPLVDLQRLRAEEDAEINTYGWVNRTTGIVRIPIDRAMDLLSPPVKGTP